MITTKALMFALAGFAAGALFIGHGNNVQADKAPEKPPAACAQWEVSLGSTAAGNATTTDISTFSKAPPPVKGPPGGWEPFAYSPGGQLVYRRCAP